MTGTENNGDKENGDKIGESHFLLNGDEEKNCFFCKFICKLIAICIRAFVIYEIIYVANHTQALVDDFNGEQSLFGRLLVCACALVCAVTFHY